VLVLDEGDGQLGAVVQLPEEKREGTEDEPPQGCIEMRCA
jgi:hypothetical protein